MGERKSTISRREFVRGTAGATLGSIASSSLLDAHRATAQGGTKQVTLRIGSYDEPYRYQTQTRYLQAFQESHPDIKIKLESADFNTFYTRLNTQIASGTAPDVFFMSGAYFYNGAMRNVFKDLGPFIAKSKINLGGYFTEVENSRYQGKLLGVPEELDIMALAYNKDLFDEAGVKYPTDEWTWDDLLTAAQKLTRKHPDGRTTYGIYAVNNVQEMWGNLVKENGGSFLTSNKERGALNSDAAIEAIQFAVDLIYKYKVSPTPQGVSSLPGYVEAGGSPFLTGLVAMKFQGNYELGVLIPQAKFRWDVVTMPKRVKKGGLSWTQSWVMYNQTKYTDEAWEFISFMLSDKGQRIVATTPSKAPTPPLKSAAYGSPFIDPPPNHMRGFLDGYQYKFSFEFHPAWFEYQTAYSKALDPVFNGSVPVKQAVDGAGGQLNEILARYKNFRP